MFWLFFFISTILVCMSLWTRRKSNLNEPPELPGGLPLIGHLHLLIGNTLHLWSLIKNISYDCLKFGGVLKVRLGPRTFYIITDPEDFFTLSNACLRKEAVYEFAKPWLGEGLVTGTPAIWKVHRKLLSPAFNQKVLDGYISIFNSQATKCARHLSCKVGQGPFDLSSFIHRYSMETIFFTTFGVNEDYLNKENEYFHATTEIMKIIAIRFLNYFLHNNFMFNMSRFGRKQREHETVIHQISNMILKSRKENYLKKKNSKICDGNATTDVKSKAFVDLVLELAIDRKAFTDQEVREEMDTMMAAGQDTVASTLLYTIILIGSYPRVQEKVFAELLQVLGDKDRDVTKHDLSHLVYLEAVLKESMRLYPVVPMFARCIETDVKLRQYTLPRGTTCVLIPYGVHRHASWGPDAEEFKPERWLDPESLSNRTGVFATFSLGRRACLGKVSAVMSMKIFLAHILRNYNIKGDYSQMILKLDIILQPETGHFIEIEKRNNMKNFTQNNY